MLKLTYSDLGLSLVRLPDALEDVIARRSLLAVRTGQALHIEPSCASFLAPVYLTALPVLNRAITRTGAEDIAITSVDDECVEINLRGLWVSSRIEAHEGIFLLSLPRVIEILLEQIWQETEFELASL